MVRLSTGNLECHFVIFDTENLTNKPAAHFKCISFLQIVDESQSVVQDQVSGFGDTA